MRINYDLVSFSKQNLHKTYTGKLNVSVVKIFIEIRYLL